MIGSINSRIGPLENSIDSSFARRSAVEPRQPIRLGFNEPSGSSNSHASRSKLRHPESHSSPRGAPAGQGRKTASAKAKESILGRVNHLPSVSLGFVFACGPFFINGTLRSKHMLSSTILFRLDPLVR